MCVDMKEPTRARVVTVVIFHSGQGMPSVSHFLESETMQHRRKRINVAATNEQIEVVPSRARTIEEGVALPVAVRHSLRSQCVRQLADEPEGGIVSCLWASDHGR
jgi:hypothetical protein